MENIIKFKSVKSIIEHLKEIGTDKHKESVAKLGIPVSHAAGVPTSIVRKLAKKIGRNQDLALGLWHTGLHEAQLLAVLIAEHKQTTPEFIRSWLEDIRSWDLCDHLCNNLIIYMDFIREEIPMWAMDHRQFFRRAAFSTMACLVIHGKTTLDDINLFLELIREGSHDNRNYVKKSVSWALREIGKSSLSGNDKAVSLACDLIDNGNRAQRWVGKDAMKELETLVQVPERRRLLTSNSKMGKKALDLDNY